MENRVPGSYDPKEGYRRFKREMLRAHGIDLERYGHVKRAAHLLGLTQQQITNWKSRGLPIAIMMVLHHKSKVHVDHVYQLERLTEIDGELEQPSNAVTELAKEIAKIIQADRPKRRR